METGLRYCMVFIDLLLRLKVRVFFITDGKDYLLSMSLTLFGRGDSCHAGSA